MSNFAHSSGFSYFILFSFFFFFFFLIFFSFFFLLFFLFFFFFFFVLHSSINFDFLSFYVRLLQVLVLLDE